MYKLLRPLLFRYDPERAHHLTFNLLEVAVKVPGALKLVGGSRPPANAAVKVMGLLFPSPVGLAAGMDKDAKHVNALSALGFGFIEVGTLTPLPQPGNDKPRLFRLPADRALINRMGFNNGGVVAAVERLKRRKPGILVGGNIGKNKATPNEQAIDDYVKCFDALHAVVDYFVVNVSSPNTPGLRELQDKGPLLEILNRLMALNAQRTDQGVLRKPILLKIAPDLSNAQLDDVIAVVKESGITGVIATNTTISRDDLETPAVEVVAMGAGGLSGVPVRDRSTEVVRYLRDRMPRPIVIIGVGGIDSAAAAMEKIEAGADLVQVYTGLIYEGPALVKRINEAYARWKG
ncbi:MAG: quinone-dependent dihydroorotate dehydrogenase [Flavobacteriales bacterium]|nr:quinone-dependent dihydroorotate dehydrogenase [Flavobacteriales bacterium]MBL0036501.1 quinone-dependent dihydroorotate dehydrogenase [Flavobacteriales bacterium]